MPSDRSLLEREIQRLDLHPFTLEGFLRRRERKQRNRQIRAGVVALVVAAAGTSALVGAFSSGPAPAGDRSPFLGIWVSIDVDGSTQTMAVRASGDGGVRIVVHDDDASVCSGVPSTMTGPGRLEGISELVIRSPVLTCDDGSEPEALSGHPLAEQLRNLTFVRDARTDALTDDFGAVWERVGGDEPSPDPTTSGGMWPQSSLDEVREAQRLADARDERYAWQVEPELEANLDDAEILARFLREELGWEEFLWTPFAGYEASDTVGDATFSGVTFVRCAPGRTNPLYPDDPRGGGCAPTIDAFRYETVQIDVAQLDRRGPSGIWVVTRWGTGPRILQAVPPSDAEVTALLEAFLQARVDGKGAEEYLPSPADAREENLPLLYVTTSGAPYERSEFELVNGPEWPGGSMEFKVRLFAEGGRTVVEQPFLVDRVGLDGRLELDYGSQTTFDVATTENGDAVALPYEFLDGEVTFAASPPWDYSFAGWDYSPTMFTLLLDRRYEERVAVLADPLSIETGCREGPAPADAEALARSILSDPDLEATEPVAVSVGGIDALRMDVVAATGASVCDVEGTPRVVTETGLDRGHRMRLYLLDLPRGSAQILAIAIVAPEPRFESVVEAAAPIMDSLEFLKGRRR